MNGALFVAGALIAYVVGGVFLGTLMRQQADKIKGLQKYIFDLKEYIVHLEEGKYPEQWILSAEGAADPVVTRGRPDVSALMERRRALVYDDPQGPPQTVDLTDLDDLPELT